ncbi:MAG: ATP-binding protein [Candidatus Eremiobacterota bacterium]
MNSRNNIEEAFYPCSNCESLNRNSSKFCRNCGHSLSAEITAKKETAVIPSVCNDKISFFTNLKESYHMGIDDLSDFLSYQQYLFEASEKGLAIIHRNTGRFIAVNSKFEEITGSSRIKLKEETFISLISGLNKINKKYDMNALLNTKEFVIFSSLYEKIWVNVTEYSGIFENNSILLSLDYKKESKTRLVSPATKKFNIIARIAEDINRSLDIEDILDSTLEKVKSITKSDVALIMFMDENKNLLPIASSGISETLIENLKALTIESDRGSRARALSLGKTVMASVNEATSLTGQLVLSENLLAMATIPLKSQDEVIGIMSIGSRRKEDLKEYIELLDVIGNQVAIAIKNSRLYIQVKEQLKELEEKNRKLKELEQAKERLTRMIVHDLKSPLTGVMSYAEYLQTDNTIKDPKLTKIYQSIYTSSQDILRMVINLLEISKMEEEKIILKLTEVNPGEILQRIKEEMQIKLLKKKLEFVVSMPDNLYVQSDKDVFYRIMTNLLDNAIKYSSSNGTITIKIIPKKKKNKILFCIIDEGKGIPEEYRKKIFDSFFKLDGEECGVSTSTGIGLTFCKLAVEAHGGKIWVKENIPHGSKFYFTLPNLSVNRDA